MALVSPSTLESNLSSSFQIMRLIQESIPELIGLSDRILRDFDDYSLLDKIIDYGKVYEVLVVERRKSLEVMKSMT